MGSRLIVSAAVAAGLGVALGAFGAHGLRGILSPESLALYETGVRYHMYHALGMLAAGVLLRTSPPSTAHLFIGSGVAFGLGILLFSGSMYLLSITSARWLGFLTPLGGIAFLVGWALLAVGTRSKTCED